MLITLFLHTVTLLPPAPLPPNDPKHLVVEGEVAEACGEVFAAAASLGFSGAVLVSDGGKALFASGAGSSGAATDAEPNSAVTLFEIASLSKQFTAAATLRLVQKKRLKLDDSIAEYLPSVPTDSAGITVRHLLQHTSGIPATNSQGGGNSISAALPSFLRGGPQHEPGTHFEYWNQGYAILSAIIEDASRKDFPAFVRAEVFKRAGLTNTGFTGDRPKRRQHVAEGRSAGRSRGAFEHPYGAFELQYRGMGGVVTNVWDLWRWDRALAGTRVLNEASKATMFEPGLSNYGLGWRISKVAGETLYEHGGDVAGFHCVMRRFPDRDAVVIVLANDDASDVRGLCRELTAALLGIDASWAEAFKGDYSAPGGRSLRVALAGDRVSAHLRWGPAEGAPVTRGELQRKEEDHLVLVNGNEEIDVKVERDGDVVIALDLGSGLRFTRD